ncbi:hypothetical protein BJ165DRAFT_1074611 [Panaeolus papilionaceus]|nr:hypothetical protein BJ165DRAFT_1074611 [Panaeolus papilionaceus]
MLHNLRQQKRGSVPYDPGDPGDPPTIESTSIEPLLSTLDELRLAIPTLTKQSQLHLQNELSDIVQRIQTSDYPLPHTHPQSTPLVLAAERGLPSNASKIGIFGGQVTFVNTVQNGDDAERAKQSMSDLILALVSVLLLGPSAHSLFRSCLSGGNRNNFSKLKFFECNISKPVFFCKRGPQLELLPNIMYIHR